MNVEKTERDLSHRRLKSKQREIRETFPENLGLRIHRALSWLERAEGESDDNDAAFIFFWISFNAAYAEDIPAISEFNERSRFQGFFGKIVSLDASGEIYGAIWDRFSASIRILLDNRYVFQPFWSYHNGLPGGEDWETKFERSKRKIGAALADENTALILSVLFDRLYVLRNQVIHGGATWNSSVNRSQINDGASILSFLVPLFIDLMMDNPEISWGPPYYPVVE